MAGGSRGSGGRLDPGLIPQNENERNAIRELLEGLRKKGDDKKDDMKKDDGKAARTRGAGYVGLSPRTARVTVRLPADARLFVDGEFCPLTSATRSFNTPALQPGKEYTYHLRRAVPRNGVRRVQSQRVGFSAGRSVTVDFNEPPAVRTVRR
jgi:uncharacterized protein (TIGR03000 family)